MTEHATAAAGSPSRPGRSDQAGQHLPTEAGRTFPCAGCGADLEFHVGRQSLRCTHCGFVQEIGGEPGAAVEEQDFEAQLARQAERRRAEAGEEVGGAPPTAQAVRCDSCGAEILFTGTLTSSECAYCGSPIQRQDVHTAEERIPVDGVLPFRIDLEQARDRLRRWTRRLWFAPNDLKRRGVRGRFQGAYLPYWTFDSMTSTSYSGQRGEHYWVTVRSGDQERRERRTRWYPAAGSFQRFFDDVLVVATKGVARKLLGALEPWPLEGCRPFQPDYLAGFQARTYDLALGEGFERARERVARAIDADVRRRIGGDQQRVHSVDTRYDAVSYKHLLLPVWLLTYRFRDRVYQAVVNACSGEVKGERPWSRVKVTLAVLAAVLTVLMIVWLTR